MEPLTRATLRGTWATVLLPLDEREAIDEDRLAHELDVLLDAGLDGIYTGGTAAEFYAIDDDEHDRVSAIVAERCAEHGQAFQIGAGHMSGSVAIGRIRRAVELRPSAIQTILPDWLPLSTDEVLFALERIVATAGGVPVVLYNPPHAKTVLTPEQWGRVAGAFPELVGIKVAGGDERWFGEMREHVPDLAIFVAGHHLATGLRHGAAGAYSNVACLSPRGAVAWYQTMKAAPTEAEAFEARLNRFFDQHIGPLQRAGYSNTALDKTLAAVGAWAPIGTRIRWPYRFVSEEVVAGLKPLARRDLPELFDIPAPLT